MGGVLLLGAPATGKDTVTSQLSLVDSRYMLFRKLKRGNGRSDGYRWATAADLQRLRDAGLVLFENDRYGNTYAVDRPGLDAVTEAGNWPVVHLADPAGVSAVTAYPIPWCVVLLTCSITTARARLQQRDPGDVDLRLAVFAQVDRDLRRVPPNSVDLTIDTDQHSPAAAAVRVHAALRERMGTCTW